MLTEAAIRAAKRRDKLFDERGLYLLVDPDIRRAGASSTTSKVERSC